MLARRLESRGEPPQDRRNARSSPLAPEVVERGDINGIAAFTDPEQEDANDDEGDQDREGDADLDNKRHASAGGGGQHQPVLNRHESTDPAAAAAAGYPDTKPHQHDRDDVYNSRAPQA